MIDWSHLKAGKGADAASIHVTARTRLGFLEDISARLAEGRGFTVATINLDHVVKIQRDPHFRQAYAQHSHVTADGNPICWFSRIAGHDVELLPGSELIAPVAEEATRLQVPVAFFGATDASLEQAAEAMRAKMPGINIVKTLSPPMGFDPAGAEADKAIKELSASGARLVFLALGAPKQEVFAVRASAAMPQAGFMSIGAGLDFISGAQTRAPLWIRKLRAEWLWRLLQNPRRLAARYGACIAILPRLLLKAMGDRRKTRQAGGHHA